MCLSSDSSYGRFSLAPVRGVPKQGTVILSFGRPGGCNWLVLRGLGCAGCSLLVVNMHWRDSDTQNASVPFMMPLTGVRRLGGP